MKPKLTSRRIIRNVLEILYRAAAILELEDGYKGAFPLHHVKKRRQTENPEMRIICLRLSYPRLLPLTSFHDEASFTLDFSLFLYSLYPSFPYVEGDSVFSSDAFVLLIPQLGFVQL